MTGLELPLVPQVAVTGQLLDCTDPGVQDLLGIEVPLLGGLLGTLTDFLNSLTGAQGLLCDALSGGLAIDTVISDTGSLPLPIDVDALTDLAGLAGLTDLPVGLLGGQDSGAFLNPTFVGPIAPEAPVGAAAATSKRVMSGTPNITDTLLSSVTSTLESSPAPAARPRPRPRGRNRRSRGDAEPSGRRRQAGDELPRRGAGQR